MPRRHRPTWAGVDVTTIWTRLGPEELRDLVTSHRSLNPQQREIISGALEIRDRMLREVLVPRRSVFFLHGYVTVGEARTAMAYAGHSRAPVTASHDLDDVVGVVHWRSLVSGDDDPSAECGRTRDGPARHRPHLQHAARVPG